MIDFTDDELTMIDYALAVYIDTRSTELSQQNSRDEDWSRLLDYEAISRKIVDYIIEKTTPYTDQIAD